MNSTDKSVRVVTLSLANLGAMILKMNPGLGPYALVAMALVDNGAGLCLTFEQDQGSTPIDL